MTYAAAAIALTLYAQGFARLRRRRRSLAPAWAACCFAAGVAVALGALISPLDRLAEERSLTAHMAQHLLLGDVAPLLLAAGLAGPRALFALPPRVLRAIAQIALLRRTLTFLRRPGATLALWAAALYAWHLPGLYTAALSHPALHIAEHACFLLTGLLVWTQILDGCRSAGRRSAFAAAVLVAGVPLAELLISTSPLYAQYPGRPDQTHAGLAMMAEQLVTLGTASLLLMRSHVERLAAVPVDP